MILRSRRTFIYGGMVLRYHQSTIERHRYGGTDQLVWEELFLVPERPACSECNDDRPIYQDVLHVEQRVVSGAMGAEFLFMGSAPSLTVQTYRRMPSSEISPLWIGQHTHTGLRSIERGCGIWPTEYTARQPPTYLELRRHCLISVYSQDQIDNLILSMLGVCRPVLHRPGTYSILTIILTMCLLFFVNMISFFELLLRGVKSLNIY
ncbi:hypothetical protein AVEN_60869-1 [Araneus ventricosus]|uniref:Uncharacterized protein n=1 Tax=Araneus ventricosus TaxID=182803 RepID=A0A4Y2RY37_ARAVE|nr:hypothetical protein AVEN_60869-1 [Araneus ventricosus]